MSGKIRSTSIEKLASDVVDTGRRGEPKPGCDCMQCFGYCMVDKDAALRQAALKHDVKGIAVHVQELDFTEVA